MSERSQGRTLRDYLRVLRQRRLIVIGALIFALGAAVAHTLLAEKRYTATSSVRFQDVSEDITLSGTPSATDPQPDKTAAQNAQRIVQPAVAARVKTALRSARTPAELLSMVDTEVDPSSNLIEIKATSRNAQRATDVANAFALQAQSVIGFQERERYLQAAKGLRKRLTATTSSVQRAAYADRISRLESLSTLFQPLEIVEPARRPGSASSPRPVRDILLAGLIGLIVGIVAAFVRDFFDRRLRDPSDVEKAYALPIVGALKDEALGRTEVTENGRGFHDADWETFRIIRSNVGYLDVDRPVKTMAVTSAGAQEGKSTVALWLAHASAVAGRSVLLVECDLRRPVFAKRLGLAQKPGLVDYLTGENEPQDVLQRVILGTGREGGQQAGSASAPNGGEVPADTVPVSSNGKRRLARIPEAAFTCITAGSPSLRPAELLASERFGSFLDSVSEAYDLVILDTSPVLPVGDTLELLRRIDAVLMCARAGKLTHEQVHGAKLALENFPHKAAGLVITGLGRDRGAYYYGYYGHYAAAGQT